MPQIAKKFGFTLVELLVALVISSILIGATVSTYTLFRKAVAEDQNRAALTQNGRVAFDRISRELRQTSLVVTTLPSSPDDTSITEPGEIEFEDGHTNDLTYHRYYVDGSMLKLDTIEYYFADDSGIRVPYNATRPNGDLPVRHVISTQDVAEDVASIAFYGTQPLEFQMTTTDGKQTFTIRTKLYERN